MSKLLTLLFLCMTIAPPSFRQTQRQHERVDAAYREKEATVKSYFHSKNLSNEKYSLFIRAFKKEMKLEAWVKTNSNDKFVLLQTYDFCTTSGFVGPKRKQGDLQIPEGVYYLNHFNPVSNFHLSLGINYPNDSDKILSDKKKPGSAIYIHGNCVTVGCIPITDDKIKELYILAVDAKNGGQEKIPVHIFPTKLSQNGLNEISEEYSGAPSHIIFWKNLQVVFEDFERSHVLKNVRVNAKGEYFF